MSDRKDLAQKLLHFIRGGESPPQEKNGLSYEEFHKMFQELIESGSLKKSIWQERAKRKKTISIQELLAAVRFDKTGTELMAQFDLTRSELQRALRKMVDAEALNLRTLSPELADLYYSEEFGNTRGLDRYPTDFQLPIWEEGLPEQKGLVLDISESGVSVLGLPAVVGQAKKLVIFSEGFLEINPFSFEAVCRWVKNAPNVEDRLSGFQISILEEPDLQELRKTVELLMIPLTTICLIDKDPEPL